MDKKYKIFIDGAEGTTGLQIHERFEGRTDIELLVIDPELRKDPEERKRLINESDITFLCLPDAASREAVSFINEDNDHTKIIDASTAHRTNDEWTAWEVGYTTGYHQGTYIRYYEDGSEWKNVVFWGLNFRGLKPEIEIHIKPVN